MQVIDINANPDSGVFDKKGTKMTLWISYQHTWTDTQGEARKNQTYYLKFKAEDKSYDGYGTELARAFELIESVYKNQRQFKTVVLYLNWNLAKTHPDKTIENPAVFKIVQKNGNLEFSLSDLKGDDNGNARKYIQEKFQRINEIHHSV